MNPPWFQTLFEEVKGSIEYRFEGLMLNVTEKLLEVMDVAEITREDLARQLDKRSYRIASFFRNSSKVTVRELFEIANALDLEVEIVFRRKSNESN
jgi:transcriptional regulator with XRE-family HTH domain